MKIITIHADEISIEPKKKAIQTAEELKEAKQEMNECLVVFMAFEKTDEENTDLIAEKTTKEIENISEQVKTKKIMLYPYAHLSNNLGSPQKAIQTMKKIEEELNKKEYEVKRAPFGWYKAFKISCKGHPLSELSREITLKENERVEEERETEALKAEKKLESHWYIMTTDGKLHDLEEFDFKNHEKLKKFSKYEYDKDRKAPAEPHHIKMMKKHELVDYEEATDPGNLRYYPKGRLMKKLLETFVTDKVVAYGGVEVETPIMYNIKHPTLEKYLQRFPARQYRIKSDDKEYFLRFAACFGQFLIAHDATLSYRHLPLKLYELTRYSFRHEQRGELTGLRRLRAFTMPDVHALCSDLEQAMSEYKKRFDLSISTLEGIGFKKEEFEMAIRITKDFYEKNKSFVEYLVKKFGKPVLIEMWDERKFYFVLKYELNFVDANDKASALSTDQIDIENGPRYDIRFVDKDGEQKQIPYILHCSPSGAIERVLYALLERTKYQEERGEAPSFPLWLAPTQVRIIPVSQEKHLEYAEKIAEELIKNEIRADVDDNAESLGKRIRNASMEWVPYIIVVGDNEINNNEYQVRIRGEKETTKMTKEELITSIKEKTKNMPWKPLPLPMLLSKRPSFNK